MTESIRFFEGSAAPVLARMWPAVMGRAIAAILFAVLAYFWAGKSSLPALTMLFAAYAVADGILSLTAALRGGGLTARSGFTLAALASVVAGTLAALWPAITTPVLVVIVGVWALTRGVLEFIGALTLRRVMERDWSLAMISGLSVLFGVMLVAARGFDTWTFVRVVSFYELAVGVLLTLLAFRFRKAPRPLAG